MDESATQAIEVSGVLRRIFGVGARAGNSRPARKLTLAALVLAVAAFGGVPAVAQAQQDDGAISALRERPCIDARTSSQRTHRGAQPLSLDCCLAWQT